MDNPITLEEREKYGRNVALVMALKKNEPSSRAGPALPVDASSIRERLHVLSQEMTSNHADYVELLVLFDDVEGWKCNGSKHCAAWANSEIGLSVQTAWEYLRVGRKLRTLTTLRSLFRADKISWSKVRIISRKADKNNEHLLCHAALDASVSDVEKLCEGYRLGDENHIDAEIDEENAQAMKQWLARSLTWNEASNGSTKIQITLPPELAQVFLNSKELRHDWESFNSVRKLMPSLYRFRIINADGKDVKYMGETELNTLNDSPYGECRDGVGEYCVTPVARRGNNEKLQLPLVKDTDQIRHVLAVGC